jgi:serine/threonine-protein kinase
VNRELTAKGWAVPSVALLTLCFGFLWYLASSSAELPDRVATHFGFGGEPDGWMSRQAAVTFTGVMGIGLPFLLIALAWLIRVLPPSLINIPRREYWLAPERRPYATALLFRHMLWLACLVVCFMGGIHYTLVRANQTVPPHMPNSLIWPMLAGFLAAMAVWIITLLRAFMNPSESQCDATET